MGLGRGADSSLPCRGLDRAARGAADRQVACPTSVRSLGSDLVNWICGDENIARVNGREAIEFLERRWFLVVTVEGSIE